MASTTPPKTNGNASSLLVQSLLTTTSLLVYCFPLLSSSNDESVMDEMYLVGTEQTNLDVFGTSSVSQVLQNDYWGRPLHGESSHKSWRPFSVLLLRYLNNHGAAGFLNGILRIKPLLFQRLVTVVIHTITAHLVASLTVKISPSNQLWIQKTSRYMSFLIFALHPAHVEVVANVANRPHVLALMCSLLTVDTSRIELIMVFWTIGLLACETMVFQLPAVLILATMIQWRRLNNMGSAMTTLLPRYAIWILLTAAYLIGRFVWGTLSIPNALLERAEAPFVGLQGLERVLSYAYIVAVHIGKSFGLDWIGFAHEYSYQCVDSITSISNFRLVAPLLVAVGTLAMAVEAVERRDIGFALLFTMSLAWLATLFPISGFVKVGTFIADRMTMPSTLVVSMLGGYASAVLTSKLKRRTMWATVLACLLFGFWAPRVVSRTKDWTSHALLFQRTLKTCPKSAKNLLQLSKLYSGSGGAKMVDLKKSLELAHQAQDADPDFCRVDFQFAHIYIQQERYHEMEHYLTRAIDCPTAASQAIQLWNRYWELQPDKEEARRRQEKLVKDYETTKKAANFRKMRMDKGHSEL